MDTSYTNTKTYLSRKTKIYALIALGVLIFLGFLIKFVPMAFQGSTSTSTSQLSLKPAKSTQTLNKEFSFPLKDEKGAEIGKIKYTVVDAALMDEIIVGGKKATALKDRTFLILNIKIVNDTNQAINMATKDYARLIVNNKEAEALAPDINNDPVTVQAISTKFTRIGFPINNSDKNLKLRIGEIKGDKQTIDLKLN